MFHNTAKRKRFYLISLSYQYVINRCGINYVENYNYDQKNSISKLLF